MIQHPFNIQALAIVAVLPIVPALSQLLTNPSHAVPAGLCSQVCLCIPCSSCLCQLGLMLCCMTIQPAGNSCGMITISAGNCVLCTLQHQYDGMDSDCEDEACRLLQKVYRLKAFMVTIQRWK